MKKRIFALLLAFIMLVGMLPVNAFATEVTEPVETTVVLCETEGCEYASGHEGNCSNFVEPTADELAAQSVMDLIAAIGDVTAESESAISAADAAYAEYAKHMALVRKKGEEIVEKARGEGRRIVVLAGRPYHVDPEINHGIDTLITQLGAAVVTEDAVSHRVEKFFTNVLNQWTYHARLYAAAKYCCEHSDCDLVHLVSFGCGVDAITSDETREILLFGGKLYTQLKIDEITNLGAVRIRLRSLFAALEEREEET